MIYIQYLVALHKLKRSIAKGYEGHHFSLGLHPTVEHIFLRNGYLVQHPPLSGGTVVRLKYNEEVTRR